MEIGWSGKTRKKAENDCKAQWGGQEKDEYGMFTKTKIVEHQHLHGRRSGSGKIPRYPHTSGRTERQSIFHDNARGVLPYKLLVISKTSDAQSQQIGSDGIGKP